AKLWIHDHPEEWKAGYYVADQGLSPADADYLVERAGTPEIPEDWTEAIARHQETVELLAEATGNAVLDAADPWDEPCAPGQAQAVPASREMEPDCCRPRPCPGAPPGHPSPGRPRPCRPVAARPAPCGASAPAGRCAAAPSSASACCWRCGPSARPS